MHNERVMDVVIAVRYCVLNPQYGPSTRQSTASGDEQKHRVDEIMSRIRQLGRLKKFLFFFKKKKKRRQEMRYGIECRCCSTSFHEDNCTCTTQK